MTAVDLATLLVDRAQVMQCLSFQLRGDERIHSGEVLPVHSTLSPPFVTDLSWFARQSSRESSPMLALCLGRSRLLAMLSLPIKAGDEVQTPFPPVSLPSQCSLLTMNTDRHGTLTLLSGPDLYADGDEEAYSAFMLDGLDPRALVRSLVTQSKYREAMVAANALPPSTQASVRDHIETAKVHEWRRTLDRHVLESIQDSNVVVAEVLSLDPKTVEAVVGPAQAIVPV